MKDLNSKFWPFARKMSILLSFLIFMILSMVIIFLHIFLKFPLDGSVNILLIGVLIFSILPTALAIVDTIIEKGASVEYKDFKVDFSKLEQMGTVGFTILANNGERGQPVSDSGTINILNSLKDATTSKIILIDLEDGHAWWETRLLVLLAGAERLRKPEMVVFIANEGGKEQSFQGWASPSDLLKCMLNDKLYKSLYLRTKAAARQWELVEPVEILNNASPRPLRPPFISGQISINQSNWAFNNDGFPNELFAEQLLQDQLGKLIEQTNEGSKHINIDSLNNLFKAVLIKDCIDQSSISSIQSDTFFNSTQSSVVICNNGKYSSMIPRMAILNEILKQFVKKDN